MDSAKIRSEIDLLIKDTTTYDKDNLPNQLLKDLAKWHWGSYGWVSPASLMFTVAWRKYYYPAVDCCKIWAADENNKPIPGGYSIRTEVESISILRCLAGVVRQVLVILPDMPRHGFDAVNVRQGQGFPYLQFPLRRDPASRIPASAELILFSYLCKNGYNQFSCYTYIFEITLFIDINQRESACDYIKMRICLHNYAALNACMSRQNTDRINDADILVLFR